MAEANDYSGNAATANHQETFAPGSVVDDRYKIISLIGQGGMGTVYLCEQIYLGTRLALKVLDSDGLTSVAIRRFQQEAKVIVSLEHHNIVTVHDFGVIGDRFPFFTMDYLEGQSLAEILTKKGTFSAQDALPIIKEVCAGLSHAHAQGIVHRDIKPSNIMILDDPNHPKNKRVCLVDFGIAKFSSTSGAEEQSLTKTGEVFGSPLYMSPEQCAGEPVDARADIYSLGCVLFEMLSGTPPFLGATAFTTMVQHYTRDKPPTLKEATLGKEFPQTIEKIVAKMLNKNVHHRYQSMLAVSQDLSDIEAGLDPRNAESIPISHNKDASKNLPVIFVSTAAAVLIALVASYFAFQTISSQRSNASSTMNSSREMFNGSITTTTVNSNNSSNESNNNTNSTGTTTATNNDDGRFPPEDNVVFAEHPDMISRIARPISAEVLDDILAHPDPDNKLDLRMRIVTSEDLEKIGKTSWIDNFQAKGAKVSNPAMFNLRKLKLWNLNLNSSNFNDIGAKGIAKMNSLKILNVGSTEVSDVGMQDISALKGLEKLELDGTEVTAQSMRALSNCKSLNWLSMRSVKTLHDEDLNQLQSRNLQFLSIEDTSIGDKSIPSIVKMPSLKTICLGQSDVSLQGVEKLLKMKGLKNIYYIANDKISVDAWKRLKVEHPDVRFQSGMHAGDAYT